MSFNIKFYCFSKRGNVGALSFQMCPYGLPPSGQISKLQAQCFVLRAKQPAGYSCSSHIKRLQAIVCNHKAEIFFFLSEKGLFLCKFSLSN